MKLYKSYMFRTKDPAIDELRTCFEKRYGKLNGKIFRDTEANGGPVAGTLRNWFYGPTRSPKNDTLEAAARANGFRRVWVDDIDKRRR